MRVSKILLITLLIAGCSRANDRQRYPINGPTPQTSGEVEIVVQNAKKLGCVGDKAPETGEPSVFCEKEPGSPRFIFTTDNKVLCGVNTHFVESCEKVWAKLNAQ